MMNSVDSLELVVGSHVYSVWTGMLRELVPWGRTHRLAVVVAGMLQYASTVAVNSDDASLEGSAAWNLLAAWETPDPQGASELILNLVNQLFQDASVKPERNNVKGMQYSIAENAIDEFVRWGNMPWE